MTARARAGSLLLLVAIGACGSPHAAPSREPTRGRSTPPRAHEADRGSTTDAAARRDADADADSDADADTDADADADTDADTDTEPVCPDDGNEPNDTVSTATFVLPATGQVLQPASPEQANDTLVETLTPREIEVLQLLAEGMTNRAIAQRLEISEHTVKFHVNALMGKLHAQSRTDAVVRATRLGLLLL